MIQPRRRVQPSPGVPSPLNNAPAAGEQAVSRQGQPRDPSQVPPAAASTTASSRSRGAAGCQINLADLPQHHRTDTQRAGDKLAHAILERRLSKYALRVVPVSTDHSNLPRALQQCNHALQHLPISTWRHNLCEAMVAAGDADLLPCLPHWRKDGSVIDQRCLPYAAALTGCVVVVFPARRA